MTSGIRRSEEWLAEQERKRAEFKAARAANIRAASEIASELSKGAADWAGSGVKLEPMLGPSKTAQEARTPAPMEGDTSGASIAQQRTIFAGRRAFFELPLPPSVNDLYGVNLKTGRKFLVPDQRAFRAEVVRLVDRVWREAGGIERPMRKPEPLAGRLFLRLRILQADDRRQDISNRIKALEDALQAAGVYLDDAQIDRLEVNRYRGAKHPKCLVEIEELG